jgi:hypothetical protein
MVCLMRLAPADLELSMASMGPTRRFKLTQFTLSVTNSRALQG